MIAKAKLGRLAITKVLLGGCVADLSLSEREREALCQVLKGMAPLLMPYLQPGTHTQCMAGS